MDDPQDQFDAIWAAAMEKYRQAAGNALMSAQLPDPGDMEAFKLEIESSQSWFKVYWQTQASLWGSLDTVLGPVELLGSAVAEGSSTVFPASTTIIETVSKLIKTAKNINQTYNYI
ncbi:hypothetical protein ABW20_dc0108440 [Dactylellina cionopaga]|nr:hypothetical protein ABW20_dc0108440 [Dactylellina cionopaga]